MGQRVVVEGALVGLFFTAIVAVLNFVAHHRLPYRKMLVLTGIMLGMVLLVMVGEQAQVGAGGDAGLGEVGPGLLDR